MNTEDDKLAKDSVLPTDECGFILDDKRKNILRVVKKISALVDIVHNAEGERNLKLIVNNLLTKDFLDRER